MPAPQLPPRIEALITRVTLGMLLFFAVLSLVAVAVLLQHGSSAEQAARLAVPVAAIVTCAAAFVLARQGRPRVGALLIVITVFVAILTYVLVGRYGVHSYSLMMLALLIVVAALLLGRIAGLIVAAAASVTVATLYGLETAPQWVDPAAVHAIPALNIVVVYVVLYGSVSGVLFMFSRAFEETLQTVDEQERRLRALLSVATLGYILHRSGRIILVNRATALTSQFERPEDMAGMHLLDLLPVENREEAQNRLDEAMKLPVGGRLAPSEYVLHGRRDKKGRERIIETLTLRVDLSDGPALLTQMREVTEERASAAALAEARDAAEMASRAKSEFVANMSHELRTPLNAIVGLTQLVEQPNLDAGLRSEYLARVRAASQSLLEIISDVLDVSKIEAGALKLESTDFDLRGELETVERVHGDLAADKGLAFSVSVAENVPRVLTGDPLRIRQVISNYLSNAIKFTSAGSVRLHVSMPREAWLRVQVSDSGIGITDEIRGRLFKHFSQADSSTTRRYGGTGLGLALCRTLVGLMGGSVGADRNAAGGSDFWAEFPAPEGDAARLAPRAGAESAGSEGDFLHGARVLLVEDNEVNRVVAAAALQRLGVVVTEAAGGCEALACVRAADKPYDAILMDVQMPDMDGYATTAAIRQLHPADRLPIIAMTAAAFAEDREHCLAAGMNDFLTKPFELRRLEALLRRWTAAGSALATSSPGAGGN